MRRSPARALDATAGFTDAGRVSSRATRRSTTPVPAPGKSVEEAVVLSLFDLSNHLQRRGEQVAATAGLTTQQWLVLLQIAGDPNFPTSARTSDAPVLASDIARVRGVSRATISAVVSALTQRGLVKEVADPADRRRRWLVITPTGLAALSAIEPARRAANRRLLAEFDTSDRKRMLDYLQRCLAVLWDVREDEQLATAKKRLAGKARTSKRSR